VAAPIFAFYHFCLIKSNQKSRLPKNYMAG